MNSEMIFWTPGTTLDEIEKQVILKAYAHYKGNKTITSKSLGIVIRTLDAKLALYEEQKGKHQEVVATTKAQHEEFFRRQRGNPPNDVGMPYDPLLQPVIPQPDNTLERHFPMTNTADLPPPVVQKQSGKKK